MAGGSMPEGGGGETTEPEDIGKHIVLTLEVAYREVRRGGVAAAWSAGLRTPRACTVSEILGNPIHSV